MPDTDLEQRTDGCPVWPATPAGPQDARPPRSPLSCERIIDAAVRYVDRDCLENLSMRRLGAELGVEAMSLYRYFASKSALLDGVLCRIMGELAAPDPAGGDWEAGIRAYARGFREVAAVHPRLLPLVAIVGPPTNDTLAAIDRRLVGLWREAGLDADDAGNAQLALQGYLAGWCLWTTSARRTREADADAAFDLGLGAFIAGIRARIGTRA